MKPRALLLLLLFFLAIPLVGTGQTVNFEQEGFLPVIPTAPNVASFNKYQEVPISKYTGLPKITIPVFSIDLQDLQVPVVLDYHAGGIRVNETASWVGQNWNLVAGGNVTRTVKHLSDDATGAGYIHTPYTTEEIYGACVWGGNQTGASCAQLTIYFIQNNLIDFEPDIFHYSAPGISGKFMFDQNRSTQNPKGRIISIPKTDHRIEPVFTGVKITGFIITDAQGNKFFFEGGDELISTDSHTISNVHGLPVPTLKPYTHSGYYQTWNLSKITTYSGKEVHFSYSSRYYNRCTFGLEKAELPAGSGTDRYTTYISTTGYETQLESIHGDFGRIDFILSANDREDHQGKYLEAVEISDHKGSLVKKVSLDYHYTTSANPNQLIYGCDNGSLLFDPQNPQGYSRYTKRLFLEAVHVEETGPTLGQGYSYHLEYNQSGVLPHRNSYAQDFWGYYNGADTNTTLCMDYRDYMGYGDPDRHIHAGPAQIGLLRKITYPEGGHTTFDYEGNKAVIVNGTGLGFRLVPSQDHRIEINTQAEPMPTAIFHNGDNVYSYRKAFLLTQRNFPLNTQGYFQYASLTNSQCVYGPGNMPFSGSCALYMNIKKTTLDPYNTPDINQVDPHTVTYDSGFDEIRKLLNGGYGGGLLLEEPGVYVVELEVRTPVVPEPGGFVFDFQTEFAQLDLYFRTAHPSVPFFDVDNDQIYESVEVPVGGRRIKSIKSYERDGALATVRNFSYSEEGQNRSSGKILSVPYFIASGGPGGSIYESSLSVVPLITTQANNMGYTRVVETKQDISGLLSDHTFIDEYSFWDRRHTSSNDPLHRHDVIPFIEDWRNGQHMRSEIPAKSVLEKRFNDNWQTVEENDITTHFFGVIVPTTHRPHRFSLLETLAVFDMAMGGDSYTWQDESFHRLQYGYPTLAHEKDTLFYNTGNVSTQTFYSYGNPDVLSPTEIEKVYGQGRSLVTKLHYPSDLPGEAHMPALIASNRIAVPVLKETYLNTALIGKQKTVYNTFNGRVLPGFIQTAKGNDPMEDRLVYDSYDGKGNPLQVSMADGPKISYIYGYEDQYPVAKIENKPYSAIPSGLISAIHTASSPTGSESQLQTALNNLRNDNSMTGAMITTYTYKPLVGVTSITGPNGDRVTYHYDAFGRLEAVKDKDGNLVQEHGYNYGNN